MNSEQFTQNPVESVRLTGEQIRSFCVEKGTALIHLLEGRAWITIDNNDVIAEAGETIIIPASRHRIIISSANPNGAIQYQLS